MAFFGTETSDLDENLFSIENGYDPQPEENIGQSKQ
jgi:hypothetical protein